MVERVFAHLQRGCVAADIVAARAQTALARFGVDLDDGPTRQVLMELEVI